MATDLLKPEEDVGRPARTVRRAAIVHTVRFRLLVLVAVLSLAVWLLGRAADWPQWFVSIVVLVPWVPVVVSELRWTHRHHPSLVVLHGLLAVEAAALLLQILDWDHASIGVLIGLLLASVATGAALTFAIDRSYDAWIARVFPDAPDHALVEATKRADVRRFCPGAIVVAEGDAADRFYIVTAGAAEVTQLTSGGEMFLHTHARGEFFGEVALVRSVPRTATVRAVSSMELLSLDRATFERLLERSASTADELSSIAMQRSAPAVPRDDAVPLPSWTRLAQRMFKHPSVMQYYRLVALVLAVNVAVALYGATRAGWWSTDGSDLQAIAIVTQLNIAFAIVFRQQYIINALAWIATRPSPNWPIRLRWALGKYYHFGGLHVGGALAGTLWYLALVVSLSHDLASDIGHVSVANVIVTAVVVVLLFVMVVMATPRLRAAQHDRFEVTHRFCGWAALMLVWLNTALFVDSQRGDESIVAALATAPTIWILAVTTVCAVWPWLLLRKVPITYERPSSHAVIINLDHGVKPGIGTTRPISRNPFVGWHHFVNVPAAPGGAGYRMVVSRAGDWTSAFVDDPPSHVWVRGIPTMGVANVRKLFRKVVLVATGSGIGPMLGHLLDTSLPSRLVWITRNPRQTYGDELVDEIEAAQPDAIIWDTDERGKPDVLRVAYAAYLPSDAEAVVCIANRKVTWQVVHGLESRGIPAFGPIWDS